MKFIWDCKATRLRLAEGFRNFGFRPRALLLSLTILSVSIATAQTPPADWVLNPPGLEMLVLPEKNEQGGHNIHPTSDGGCIIAACVSNPGKGRDMGVYKLTPDLKPDPAFGKNGLWTAGSTGVDQAIDAIEITGPDGKPDGYLVVGIAGRGDADFSDCGYHAPDPKATTANTNNDIIVARLTRDGKPDPRFGKSGLRCYGGADGDLNIYHSSNYSEPGNKLLQVKDGFLVASVTRSKDGDLQNIKTQGYSQSFDTWIIKIDARGEFVRDFADRGHLRIGLSPTENMGKRPNNEYPWSIKADPAADGFIASGYHFGLGYSPSGKKTAKDIIPSPGNASRGDSNAEKETNDVNDAGMDGWLLRATSDGKLRAGWAGQGIAFFGGSRQEKMYDHTVTPDGGYIICGRTSSNDLAFERPGDKAEKFGAFLLKLDRHGALDTTFGTYQRGVTFMPECGQQVSRVANYADTDIIAACVDRDDGDMAQAAKPASDTLTPPRYGTQFVLVRLDKNGRPLRYWSLGKEGDDWLCGMDVDAKGRVLMTGYNDKGRPPGEKKTDNPGEDKKGVHPYRDLVVMRFTPTLGTPGK